MKKIIAAIAIAFCAVAVNAATVNWNVNVMQSSPSATVGAGWAVQVFSSAVEYDYAKALSGEITAWSSGSSVAAGATFRTTGAGTQDNGTTASYYMVIYDASSIAEAKNYIVSELASVTINAAGSTGTLGFGNMSGTSLTTNKFYGAEWVPVPEPTSGLLLLLGMAGLALKRKQA